MSRRVTVNIDRAGPRLRVDWEDGKRTGGSDFDEVPETVPRWIGSAEDLFEGADRQVQATVIDELAAWAREHETTVGIFHTDGTMERVD